MNLDTAQKRSKIIQKIRDFFTNNGFLEVETPIMTKSPGMEPHLTPFETTLTLPSHLTSLSETTTKQLYLNTSPELQMKKLLATQSEDGTSSYPQIFNITKVFRNGELGSDTHNPEFTMLEWYRTDADYKTIMDDCENLIAALQEFSTDTQASSKAPFLRKSTRELFLEYLKIDLLENRTFEKFRATADSLDLDTNACTDWDDIFFKLFLNHIERNLGHDAPTIVYDYPSTQAALAKKSATEPFFAERFELYINGIELANAFTELTNPNEQRERLLEEQALRKKMNKTILPIDEEFLSSLESLHRTGKNYAGIALGIDRLIMVLLGKKSIAEVLHFPITI